MNSKTWNKEVVGLVVGTLLVGFVFPPFFVISAILLISLAKAAFWPTVHKKGHPLYDPRKLPATDRAWRDEWLSLSESPAESGFLNAMIDRLGLFPADGTLSNGTLSLNHQVEIPSYRADFLVNERLVVEIDGAAYHSSPEAIARDSERDRYMEAQGYSILRIPARVVFQTPLEAVDRVTRAVAALPPKPLVIQEPLLERIGSSINQFSKVMDDALKNATTYKPPALPEPLRPQLEMRARERADKRLAELDRRDDFEWDYSGTLRRMKREMFLEEERSKLRGDPLSAASPELPSPTRSELTTERIGPSNSALASKGQRARTPATVVGTDEASWALPPSTIGKQYEITAPTQSPSTIATLLKTVLDSDLRATDLREKAKACFLEAITRSCRLKQDGLVLRSFRVKLAIGVKIGEHRVDYLINDTLVVEIDSGSPLMAPVLTTARDEMLVSSGFEVLRVPAQEVLEDPRGVVGRVTKRVIPIP